MHSFHPLHTQCNCVLQLSGLLENPSNDSMWLEFNKENRKAHYLRSRITQQFCGLS